MQKRGHDLAAGAVADVEDESAAAIGPVADEGAAGRGERIDLDAGNVDAVVLEAFEVDRAEVVSSDAGDDRA